MEFLQELQTEKVSFSNKFAEELQGVGGMDLRADAYG